MWVPMKEVSEEETRLLFEYEPEDVKRKFSKSRSRRFSKSLFYTLFIASVLVFIVLYGVFCRQEIKIPKTLLNLHYEKNCTLQVFDPWDEAIKPFMEDKDKTKYCDRNWRPYTELVNGTWRVVKEKEGRTCRARCHLNFDLVSPSNISDWFPPGPTDCEFLEAVCWENDEEVYGYIHTQIIPMDSGSSRINKEEHPDVFVILVDSLSSGMAKRSLPKSVDFFMTQLQAVEFPFLSPVGARSQANAVPLWFGKQTEAGTLKGGKELPADWSAEEYCRNYLDDKPNLFRDFEEAGYTTVYTDDWFYQTLTNHPDCNGFKNFYTNHTFFPFTKIWEQDGTEITKKHLAGDKLCREVHLAAMEYSDQFFEAYKDRPKFVWNWFVHLAHNFLAEANRLDAPMLTYLERNFDMFNNAFVIFTADHGFQYGPSGLYETAIGQMEKNNPFLAISVPKKYRENGILEVMKGNAKSLQSQYDTRATLLDILKYQPSSNFADRETVNAPDEKGHSYLRHQPSTPRNCENLPIPQQYCLCQSNFKDMTSDIELSQRLAKAVIDHVHKTLDTYNLTSICHRFKVEKVTHLDLDSSSTTVTSESYHISVKSQHPAHFDTLVTVDKNSGEVKVDEILRLDRYGTTAQCSKEVFFSQLCYCKN